MCVFGVKLSAANCNFLPVQLSVQSCGCNSFLTQQKDLLLQLSYSFLLVCHKILSVVLAEVRPYSILLSAVSPSACYPS